MTDIAGIYDLGPGSGRLLLKTGRVGLAAKVGHDLTIEVTRWSARVTVPGNDPGSIMATTVAAELDLSSLAVLEGTGGAKPLSDKDRRDIEGTMRKILGDAARASFASARVLPAPGGPSSGPMSGAIEGTLTLHGTSRPVAIEVRSPVEGQYQGRATVRQTDFGITPYSGFFGALKLRDEVIVELEVKI